MTEYIQTLQSSTEARGIGRCSEKKDARARPTSCPADRPGYKYKATLHINDIVTPAECHVIQQNHCTVLFRTNKLLPTSHSRAVKLTQIYGTESKLRHPFHKKYAEQDSLEHTNIHTLWEPGPPAHATTSALFLQGNYAAYSTLGSECDVSLRDNMAPSHRFISRKH